MDLFTDGVQSALERAMDGVALRQRVMSQNVANAMTPGYQAQKVEFEGALSDALRTGTSPADVTPTVTGTGAASNESGNNVELETEATGLMRNGLQYEALVQATSYRLGILRAAVR
ncbi:MAG: flgB [Frankiales bacterium]|nr:flgB [Frankiales bacterium]